MATYWENSCSFGLRYVSWYKCLIVSLVFSHLGFWSGNLFLIAPYPDLCLLVPFHYNWLGPELLVCCMARRGSTIVFRFRLLQMFLYVFLRPRISIAGQLIASVSRRFLIHQCGYHLLIFHYDSLTS